MTAAFDWSTESTNSVETRIRRDRWSRYLIPHPDTGNEQAWTRATTLAGTLADRYGLEQWAKRNVVLGIGARHDLYALAASCTDADRDELNKIVGQAEEAAKGKAGANAGTAMHRLTERADRGETVAPADPQLAADLNAYRLVMGSAGIRVAHSADGTGAWIERVLVVPQIGVAGTCDRVCLNDGWALPRIGDVKTAKDVLRYGMVEIALQLAIYAHATHWYDPATNRLHPMPPIDQQRAVVMHLPVGQATCTLYEVDIEAGWQAVQLALDVRAWRKRKDLAQIIPVMSPGLKVVPTADEQPPRPGESAFVRQAVEAGELPATVLGPTPERIAWLRGRVQTIIDQGHGDELAAIWAQRPDIPTVKQGGLTDEAITVAAGFCAAVEMEHGMAFHGGDPNLTVDPPDPTPTTASVSEPVEPPERWAEAGRELLATLGDDDLARAIAEYAGCADLRITEDLYRRLEAVHNQVGSPTGVIYATTGPDGWVITIAPQCLDILKALYGSARSALISAKRHARTLGIAAPRSLANVADNPLLAAVTAVGATTSNDGKE